MRISEKIARMAMGYGVGKKKASEELADRLDIFKNHVQPDPYDTEGEEVELAAKEESKANILKQYSHYIDRLVVFHTDTMELLRYIDYHWVGTDNRLATKAKIAALIKQGKEMEYEVRSGGSPTGYHSQHDSDKDFRDSHNIFPNSHNTYGVKEYIRSGDEHG